MPRFDRTGPAGAGPMTGRGMGACGRGQAVGGRGYGMGRGAGLGYGYGARWSQPQSSANNLDELEAEKKKIEEEIKRLKENE